jgi:tetratricopeptide (TPR) repeat protein
MSTQNRVIAELTNSPHLQHIRDAFECAQRQQYHAAISHFKKGWSNCDNPAIRIFVAQQFSLCYSKVGHRKKWSNWLNIEIGLRKSPENPDYPDYQQIAVGQVALGHSYYSQMEYKEAIPYCLQALEIFEKCGLPGSDKWFLYRMIGNCYSDFNENIMAIYYLHMG